MTPNARLLHDTAVASATATMEFIGHLVRPEERNDLWLLLVEATKAAIESYLVMHSRMNKRLCKPSEN